MLKAALILFFSMFLNNLIGQTRIDSLFMKKFSGNYHFYIRDHQVRFIDLQKIVRIDNASKRHYLQANLCRIGYSLLSGGAFLFLSSSLCEKYIEEKDVDLFMVGAISAGMIALAIPLRKIYSRQARNSIDAYNRNIKE
jgi:hypothetical protein